MNTDPDLVRSFVLTFMFLFSLGGSLSHAQPANDMFANRIVITGTNIVVTGSSVGATRETGEPYHAGNTGGASVWWSWKAPYVGTVTISTAGSSFDTLLGIYTGTSVSALTEVASNDDENPGSETYTSKVVCEVVANQTYQIAVDGYDGASGSAHLSVQLGPLAPPPAAPSWQLPDQNGVTVYSTNFAGKVVVLDFWATGSNPCKAEMPDLVALQNEYRADGLAIVGADVSWGYDTAQAVQTFMVTNAPPLNYQLVMSTLATETAYGGVNAIPATFIIDRQNVIRTQLVGNQSRSTLEQQIIPLLYCNTRLACERSGNQMVLRWPTNVITFTLESANTVRSPTWSAWPSGPTVVNGTNTVQVPMTNAPHYFRLHLQY